MKKNIIIVILIVAVIALAVLVVFLTQNKDKNVNTNTQATTNNSSTENNVNKKADETQNKQDVNTNTTNTTTPTTNTSNTNAKVYIVRGTNIETIGVNIDDSLSVIDKAKSLINEIGNAIGYKIIINTITSGKGGMSIDFNKDSAPFNVSTTYIGNGKEKYHLLSVDDTASTIFDSIKETLQNYFGKTMDVYYSMDEKDINMENIGIKIPKTEPYNKK